MRRQKLVIAQQLRFFHASMDSWLYQGTLFLVVGMTSAVAVLAASFVLVPVAESESGSKQLQRLAGAPASAFWLSNLAWDLVSFSLSAAGIVALFWGFELPQYQGERLQAFAVLMWAFGLGAIPLAYFLHFLFKDEVKAGQRILQAGLLVGFLGFIATWILDFVYLYNQKAGVHQANRIIQVILRAFAPHFLLSRGLYNISQTYRKDAYPFPLPNQSPWTWEASGQFYVWALIQFAVYFGLTVLVELGVLRALGYQLRRLWRALRQGAAATCLRVSTAMDRQPSPGQYARLANGEGEAAEDEDVQQERLRLQDAGARGPDGSQVLIHGLKKAYWQGPLEAPVQAVRGLWAGIPQGDCFGLLGVNGAGKTTTFKVITGEESPDEGDVSVCGASVTGSLSSVRQQLGYCPQHSALPGRLTGREALRLYARLRGVVPAQVEGVVAKLLQRLDLQSYADRACETYSGGNKRKLSVALALVGDPPVVLLDEPSTGMDPGAKRFLWRIIRSQVIDQGHTVVLTSHSMEECEALCTRLGIMAAGRLVCLGSPQHLKSRFGAGYVLEIRRQTGTESQQVDDFVRQACASVSIHHHDSYRTSYLIPRQALEEGLALPQLFASIEQQKGALGVDEYSISQTTLEHVFVALAQGQQEHSASGQQDMAWV